jgi:hypothetical protein
METRMNSVLDSLKKPWNEEKKKQLPSTKKPR